MTSFIRRAGILTASALCLGACTTIQSATRQAVRYNSAFSNARNEILLLNILRARQNEPLQFSTISTVTGPMRGNINITTGLEWVFHAGDTLSPGGGFTFRDPAITLTPLESKEFRQGMMKSVDADYYSALLRQGWAPELVKELVLETPIVCVADDSKVIRSTWLSGAEAAGILKDGIGDDLAVRLSSASRKDGKVQVTFLSKRSSIKVDEGVCPSGRFLDPKATRFRSPLAIINYLAVTPGALPILKSDQRKAPSDVLVATFHRDGIWYVPRSPDSGAKLSLLAEIIGFQTTDAALQASKPTVTVNGD